MTGCKSLAIYDIPIEEKSVWNIFDTGSIVILFYIDWESDSNNSQDHKISALIKNSFTLDPLGSE